MDKEKVIALKVDKDLYWQLKKIKARLLADYDLDTKSLDNTIRFLIHFFEKNRSDTIK